ncbi:hypothetical protein GJ496_006478 [Pomphorhynchus laevis]|nr:hypothetical protein GJ496_006478 [Pomphorhynchus laevis]
MSNYESPLAATFSNKNLHKEHNVVIACPIKPKNSTTNESVSNNGCMPANQINLKNYWKDSMFDDPWINLKAVPVSVLTNNLNKN